MTTVALAHQTAGPVTGPPVVLLHSIGTDHRLWREQIAPLANAGRRVVAVDLRGHGGSPAPAGPYAVADLAGDVLALLDRLAIERAAVAGVSLGGAVGLWLAIHAGDRVARLAACCTAAWFGGPAAWEPRAAAVRAGGTAAIVELSLDRWLTPAFRDARPDVADALRATLRATADPGYLGCAAALGAVDLRPDLGRIAVPTLVIAGRDDQATTLDGHLRPLAAAIPEARLAVVSGAAHLAPLERPAEVSALLAELLDGPDPAAPGRPTVPNPNPDPEPPMSQPPLDEDGLRVRREVLGDAHVDRALADSTPFSAPFQQFVTRTAWGDVWSRPGLDRRARSVATLAALVSLRAEHELPMHVRAAIRHGLTPEEIAETLLHTALYAGLPAANRAFAIAQETLREDGLLE